MDKVLLCIQKRDLCVDYKSLIVASFDALLKQDQQPQAAERPHQNRISKGQDKQQAPPRKELHQICKVACNLPLLSLSAHFGLSLTDLPCRFIPVLTVTADFA